MSNDNNNDSTWQRMALVEQLARQIKKPAGHFIPFGGMKFDHMEDDLAVFIPKK